eukprot:g3999.t1
MEDDLEYDLAYLTASDEHPFEEKAMNKSVGKTIRARAEKNVQLLVNKIFSMEKTEDSTGVLMVLPPPVNRCPREKPVPEPREETRWEKFAKERGIKKRKRERMVWDEDTESWRPRYGYKRDGKMKDWLIPVKKTDPDNIDKFEEKRLTKREKSLKNELNRVTNIERASKKSKKSSSVPSGIPTALDFPRPLKGNSERAKRSKRGMKAAKESLRAAQLSTASMGQFDDVMAGEGRKGKGVRRQFISNQANTKTRDMQLLQLALNGNLPGKQRSRKNASGGGGSSGGGSRKGKGKKGGKRR